MSVLYEDILEMVGGFGRYQLLFYFWLLITLLHDSGASGFMIFANISPIRIDCKTSVNESRYFSLVKDNMTECYYYQFESLVMEWNLLGDRRFIGPLMASIQNAGSFFGPLFFGRLADAYGRKVSYLACSAGLVLTGVACGVSVGWKMFASLRFFHGMFVAGAYGASKTWLSETVPQRWRLVRYILGPMHGYLFLALLVAVCNGWRQVQFFYLLPVVVSFPVCFLFIQESPKWLLQKGKTKEALSVLHKIGRWNKVNPLDLPDAVANYSFEKKRYELWHLFQRKKLALETITLSYSWLVTGATFYGLLFNLNNVTGSVVINFVIIMTVRLAINTPIAILDRYSTRMGRRILHQMGLLITGSLMLIMAIFLGVPYLRKSAPFLARVPGLLGCGFCGFLWSVGDLYAAELFPTSVRAAGMGMVSTAARIGTTIAPQVCLLTDLWISTPYTVFLILLFTNSVLAYFFLPETKGRPLPEFSDTREEYKLSNCNSDERANFPMIEFHEKSSCVGSNCKVK